MLTLENQKALRALKANRGKAMAAHLCHVSGETVERGCEGLDLSAESAASIGEYLDSLRRPHPTEVDA